MLTLMIEDIVRTNTINSNTSLTGINEMDHAIIMNVESNANYYAKTQQRSLVPNNLFTHVSFLFSEPEKFLQLVLLLTTAQIGLVIIFLKEIAQKIAFLLLMLVRILRFSGDRESLRLF
jgi:hypothetical protein